MYLRVSHVSAQSFAFYELGGFHREINTYNCNYL